MRFYGMRSGRNNMSKLIARSYMYNSKKKSNTKQNNISNTNECGCGTILLMFIIIILLIILFM